MSKWQAFKIRDFAKTASGGTPSTERIDFWENGTIPWINSGELSQNDFIREPTTYITKKGLRYSSAKLFPKGTVGIALTGATTGMVAYLEIETTSNQSITGIFPNYIVDNLYLFYNLKNRREYILSFNVGSAQPHINKQIVDFLEIRFPEDINEQSKIAEILYTIDRTIEQIEALIAKYQRIKTGLMHFLYTRGIDENGQLRDPATHKFKPSPLGMIPIEWEVGKLSNYFLVPTRNGLYKQAYYYGIGTHIVQMTQMFMDSEIDLQYAEKLEISKIELDRFGLEAGDLLFARRSLNFEGAGKCCIVGTLSEPAVFESSIVRVRLNQNQLNSKFTNFFLNSDYGYRVRIPFIRQVAVSGVSSDDICNFIVLKPEIREQLEIVQILEKCTSSINHQLLHLRKLNNIKSGLMQDLLTGKISVVPLMHS